MNARVVMVAQDGDSTRIVYHHLARELGVAKVILEEPVPARQLLKRRAEKLGLRAAAGQVLFKALVDVPLKRASRARVAAIKAEKGLDDRPIPGDKCVQVTSINAPEAIAALKELAPAVVVVNGTRIIAKKVLEAVSAPFINMHAGITPLYRGVHGGYWAMAEGDREHCGVTVHLVNAGIDTGGILGQARITPAKDDNFVTYPYLQVAAGLPLLTEAVSAALAGTLTEKPAPAGASRLWSHPTLGQYLKARVVRGVR